MSKSKKVVVWYRAQPAAAWRMLDGAVVNARNAKGHAARLRNGGYFALVGRIDMSPPVDTVAGATDAGTCLECGMLFTPANHGQDVCSKACFQRYVARKT